MRIVHLLPAVLGAGLMFAAPAHAQAARTYDCSKPGNANKTACKPTVAAKAVTPAAVKTTTTVKTRNYNCALPGNANKVACKTAPAAAPAPAAPAAPVARATSVSRSTSTHTVSTSTTTNAGGNGATAICKDGTYSHSAHHSGSCSHHGGVKQFY